jgi:hypothetical protein
VGDIAADVIKFAIAWTTTGSDYDVLISRTFSPGWATVHRPVISRGLEDHTLYIGHTHIKPNGIPIKCPKGHPSGSLAAHTQSRTRVIITCKECKSTGDAPLVNPDGRTELGRSNLVKVSFRRHLKEQTDIPWTLGKSDTPHPPVPKRPNPSRPQKAPPHLPQITTDIQPPLPHLAGRLNVLSLSSTSLPNSPSPSPSPSSIQLPQAPSRAKRQHPEKDLSGQRKRSKQEVREP